MNMFTCDLIDWIEKNLTDKLTIDDVAARAGYSKWHLQRIFREETGYQLASYIRYRKLNKAAMILKMTRMPAAEIGELLGFSTQQTFTRSFTRHFGCAPGQYRESHDWSFHGMVAKAGRDVYKIPEAESVAHGPALMPGHSLSYSCHHSELDDLNYHCEQRKHLLTRMVEVLEGCPPSIVAEHFEPEPGTGRVIFTLTFQAMSHNVSSGRFLRFRFSGNQQQLIDMQAGIYQHLMPLRPEARRTGPDFFVCHTAAQQQDGELSDTFSGDYYIPVSAVPRPQAA